MGASIVGMILRGFIWLGTVILSFTWFKSEEGFKSGKERMHHPQTLERPQDVPKGSSWQWVRGFIPPLLLFGGCSLCAGFSSPEAGGWIVVGVVLAAIAGGIKLSLDNHRPPIPKLEPLDLPQARVYSIRLPRSTPWQPQQAYQFMNHLLLTFERLTFQIVATRHSITWQVIDARVFAPENMVITAIRSIYPEAEIEVSGLEAPAFSQPIYRSLLTFSQLNLFPAPICPVTDLTQVDPLVGLTSAMSELAEGEQITYTLVVCGLAAWAQALGWDEIRTWDIQPMKHLAQSGVSAVLGTRMPDRPQQVDRFASHFQSVMEAKLNQPLYQGLVFLQLDTPDIDRVAALLAVSSHILQLQRLPFNSLNLTEKGQVIGRRIETASDARNVEVWNILETWIGNRFQGWKQALLVLEVSELAAVWHLPNREFSAPTIAWTKKRQARLPQALVGKRDGLYLGGNIYAGRSESVYFTQEDRKTHLIIIGKTGTGKTTQLKNLIRQDIEAGVGVMVIDMDGDLIRDLLRTGIPTHREDDLVLLDVANMQHPVPMNLLSIPNTAKNTVTAGQIVALIEHMTGRLSETPRVADTLGMVLYTLWQDDAPTLLDMDRLFEDVVYRQSLIDKADNIAVRRFWEQFDRQSAAQQEQLSYPISYRMRSLYGNSALLPMVCHPDSLDLGALMQENKIILISLAVDEKVIPRRERQLLGALLVSTLQMIISTSDEGRLPYSVYIDEAEHLVTTDLPELFVRARKRNLKLTLANQYFKQLAGDTLEAVMGNIGAIMAFQCSPGDAHLLSPYMQPGFSSEDLVNLDKFEAAVWMRHQGQTQPAFSLTTLPPIETDKAQTVQREVYLRERSTARYTPKTREEVLAWIQTRYSANTQHRAAEETLYD